jgi:NADPH2:quinone reductase
MQAAYLHQTGTPEVVQVGSIPEPTVGPGQVFVRVDVAAINPIDVYIRAGLVSMPLPWPFITGTDFAGVVEAVGPGVSQFQVGQRVWGSNQGLLGRQGSCAEFLCSSEEYVYPALDAVSPEQSAALALTGITAWLGLFQRMPLQPGETLFVHGGTGGVGSLVIQMAKAIGARAITTVGSPAKAELARLLGADVVLDYRQADLTESILAATGGAGVDLYYETQPPSDLDAVVARVRPYGRVVVMAGRAARPAWPNGPFYVKGLAMLGFAMFNIPPEIQRQAAQQIQAWAATGQLRAIIGATYPLAETAAAHRFQEENTLGKAGTLNGKIIVRVR